MTKGELIRLYNAQGLSALKISKKSEITVWRVYSLMKKFGLSRRTPTASNQLNFVKSKLSFAIKKNLSSRERALKIAGLMLYWAEGSKRGRGTVDLANSDSTMIRLFLRLLRELYGVDEKRLRVLLYCYPNHPASSLIEYWSKLTRIPTSQFTRPYVRGGSVSDKYDKMPNGLVHIRYSDKRLWQQILEDIGKLTGKLLG